MIKDIYVSHVIEFSRRTKASDKDVSVSSNLDIKNLNTFMIFKMWRKISGNGIVLGIISCNSFMKDRMS
jgi:hypothetical protein